MKRLLVTIPLLLAALIPAQAMAYDWVTTSKVTYVEGSVVPENLPFGLESKGNGSCARINWAPPVNDPSNKPVNMQSTYALLMTAIAANRNVQVFGNNDCTANFIYLN